MRVLFTISILLYSITMKSQPAADSGTGVRFQTTSATSDVKIRIRCLATGTVAAEPLLVVNGVPVDFKNLNGLVPSDIESVSLLRDSNAVAIFGCRASNGVIIVTTKKAGRRTFRIRDRLDGSNVAGATVSFISGGDRKDTLMFVSNDSGWVTTDQLDPGSEYELEISSTGYKTFTAIHKSINSTTASFFLERDVVNCLPVIITADAGSRCRRSGCTVKGISICRHLADVISLTSSRPIKIYPNPVLAGGTITIEINGAEDRVLYANLLAPDGRQLFSRAQKIYKGKSLFSFGTGSRMSAGVYFVQVMDEKRNVLMVEKAVVGH